MDKNKFILFTILIFSLSTLSLCQTVAEKIKTADSLMAAGNYYRASDLYKEILTRQPGNADIKLKLGKAYFYSGNYDKAENRLNEVIKQAPAYEDAYLVLSNVYFASGNRSRAIKTLENLYEIDPDRQNLSRKIFLTAVDNNDYPTARKYYEIMKDRNADLNLPGEYIRKILEWEFYTYYGDELISERSNWNDFTAGASYKFSNDVTIAGSFQRFGRFDKADDVYSLSSYFSYPQRVAWYVNAGIASGPDFLPGKRIDITAQPYLPEGFSILGSFSYLSAAVNDVSIYSAGLEKYILPDVNLSYQYIAGFIQNSDETSHSHLIKLNLYKNNYRATLGYSNGSELYDSPNTLFSFSVNTYSIFMTTTIWVVENTAVNINIAYTNRINNYARKRIGAGIVYKF